MKNIIIGDVHGHFKNLRDVLLQFEAINEMNQRINRDTISVYCTGDLIDGAVNRQGDLLILDYAADWFDEIVIGNHELPFFGGPAFRGLRKYDRELQLRLLELENRGIYVPSTVVDDHLLVHAGLSERWSFNTAQDCDDVLRMVWRDAEESVIDIPMLDWVGPGRSAYGNDVGGIFWLDWSEERNKNINQIVGHSTITTGPILRHNDDEGTDHWNIDVGGKYGCCLGGVILEDGKSTPFFWGHRIVFQEESLISNKEKVTEIDSEEADETSMWKEMMEEVND